MKKMIMAAAIVCAAAFANAAAVGWSCAGLTSFAGNQYYFCVLGQNGVSDVATISALLTEGSDISSYAFGGGKVAANGAATVAATTAGQPTLGAGTYTGFYVLFDSNTPAAGESKYLIISDAAGLTKSVSSTAATVGFVGGNQSAFANNSANWQSFGSAGPIAPEPTSGLLLLLGMAGLALKRKHA